MSELPPIEFQVAVQGKPLTARVVEIIDNPINFEYRIQFSDGYIDNFSSVEEQEVPLGDLETSAPYARALLRDFVLISCMRLDLYYHIFQETIDGMVTNVWVTEREDTTCKQCYAVYYNQFYRFDVRRKKETDEWDVATRSVDEKINFAVAERVKQLLNSVL